MVPTPLTSNSRAAGRFDKRDFEYIAKDNEYECPAGERAIHRFSRTEAGLFTHVYWSSACTKCGIRERCTPFFWVGGEAKLIRRSMEKLSAGLPVNLRQGLELLFLHGLGTFGQKTGEPGGWPL